MAKQRIMFKQHQQRGPIQAHRVVQMAPNGPGLNDYVVILCTAC